MKVVEWFLYSAMFVLAVAMWTYLLFAFMATFLGAEPC
jgi:hypothetical protein